MVRPIPLLLLLISGTAVSQTTTQLNSYQLFENARQAGRLEAAIEFGEQSLNADRAEYGANSPETVQAMVRLALVRQQLGHLEQAESDLLSALRIAESQIGDDHPDLVPLLDLLASVNQQRGRLDSAASYLTRVLAIERSSYGERSDNVIATLERLRAVYEEDGQVVRQREVEMQLRAAAQYSRDLGVLDQDSRRYALNDGYATVRVFYGTNRAQSGNSKPAEFYGSERGELELGYVDVSIPETHKYGELETESPFSIYSYVLGDAAKKRLYVLLQSINPLPANRYYDVLSQFINDAPSDDVFVLIHGYNVSFGDAARRAAQLAYDLDFYGTPMLYSWPSKASTAAYTVDEAVVRPSGRKLARFLDGLIHETGADRVHLIAHSMGNRALLEALQAYVINNGLAESAGTFDQIVLTAPDVDYDYFLEAMDSVSSIAKRITLYVSENDIALQSSRILHGAARAGLAGDVVVNHPAIDTIDVSGIDADVLGHSYFAVNEGAIYDLFRLFWLGDSPPQRCGMREQEDSDARYWLFDLENCRGSDLLQAGLIYRRFGAGAIQRIERHIAGIDDRERGREWTAILDRLRSLVGTVQ